MFEWEKLYSGFENERDLQTEEAIESDRSSPTLFKSEHSSSNVESDLFPEHYQFKQKYILTSVKSGLMIIDQRRAHIRILFDKYLEQIKENKGVSQRVLFPEVIELSVSEAAALPGIMDDLEALGFELSDLGNCCFAIQGVPSGLESNNPSQLIHNMISKSIDTGSDVKSEIQESMALALANSTAIPYGRTLTAEEMLLMVSQLFVSSTPSYTPDGQLVISLISDVELDKKMR